MRKLKEVPNSAPKNVTNALFVGSTAELQKMLKGKSLMADATYLGNPNLKRANVQQVLD